MPPGKSRSNVSFSVQFYGAAGQVTGSLYAIRTNRYTVLLECGLVQGEPHGAERNLADFPVPLAAIDAVILSHAHIDHSGRIPLLFKRGYERPIYTQHASVALC